MIKTARAMDILREADESVPLYKVAKGILKAVGQTLKGAGEAGEKAFKNIGMEGTAKVMRYAPHTLVGAGAVKGYTSEPVQRARHNIREWRARRAMR